MTRLLFLTALLLNALLAVAAPVGEVTHLSGTLSVIKSDGSGKVLSVKSTIEQGDRISTEADSYARVKFIDGAEVVLRPKTHFKVENYHYDESKPESDSGVVSLLKGGLRAVTGQIGKRNKEKIAYQTPTATIGIRGTHLGAQYCQDDCEGVPTPSGRTPANGLHVDVASGSVWITNESGRYAFEAGQFAYVSDSRTPPQQVPADQAVRVTMPSGIAANRGSGDGIGGSCAGSCGL